MTIELTDPRMIGTLPSKCHLVFARLGPENDWLFRFTVRAIHQRIRLLSGAVHRHHLHDSHPSTDALLRIQPHSALCSYLFYDDANIHATARRRRKNIARYNVFHSH